MNSFQVIIYSRDVNDLVALYTSEDGKQFNKSDIQPFSFKVDNVNKFRIIFQSNTVSPSTKYLKVELPASTSGIEIGKVVIGYGTMKVTPIAPPKVFVYKGEVKIDDFEGYQGDVEKLKNNFAPNRGGGKLTVSLDKNNKSNGEYGLKLEYTFGTTIYAGGTFNLNSSNWTGNDTISLWVKPDGSKNIFVIQFREANGEYWEIRNLELLKGNKAQILKIKLSDFRQPSWGGKIDGKLDVSEIKEFSIYVNRGEESVSDSGTLYYDDIAIMMEK